MRVEENLNSHNKIIVLMDLINFLYNEYVYGGHIAGTALLGTVLTFGFIGNDVLDFELLLTAYFVPLIVYSYDHYRDIKSDKLTNPERAQYLETKARYYPYIIGTYVTLLIAFIIYGSASALELIQMLAFVAIVVGGGLLYAVSFKNFTKYIPAYKNIFVSLEWALAATFLFIIYSNEPLTAVEILIFAFVFLKYMTNTIFCDLKDIKTDREKGLKTLPVLIGFNKTIIALCLLSLITLVPLFYGIYINILPVYAMAFIIFAVYDIAYILLAYKNKNKKNWTKYGFMADIEITLWPIVLIPLILIIQNMME